MILLTLAFAPWALVTVACPFVATLLMRKA
jgi:hypothetical protein